MPDTVRGCHIWTADEYELLTSLAGEGRGERTAYLARITKRGNHRWERAWRTIHEVGVTDPSVIQMACYALSGAVDGDRPEVIHMALATLLRSQWTTKIARKHWALLIFAVDPGIAPNADRMVAALITLAGEYADGNRVLRLLLGVS